MFKKCIVAPVAFNPLEYNPMSNECRIVITIINTFQRIPAQFLTMHNTAPITDRLQRLTDIVTNQTVLSIVWAGTHIIEEVNLFS